MTEKKLDIDLLDKNLHSLFEDYIFSCRTLTERCVVETIIRDVEKIISESFK